MSGMVYATSRRERAEHALDVYRLLHERKPGRAMRIFRAEGCSTFVLGDTGSRYEWSWLLLGQDESPDLTRAAGLMGSALREVADGFLQALGLRQ